MNCARCNAFLPPEARFCHVCGLVVAIDASKAAIIDSADSAQAYQPAQEVAPTSPWQVQALNARVAYSCGGATRTRGWLVCWPAALPAWLSSKPDRRSFVECRRSDSPCAAIFDSPGAEIGTRN